MREKRPDIYNKEFVGALLQFNYMHWSNLGSISKAQVINMKFPFMVKNSLAGKEWLGNPQIDFPMAMLYGD